MDRLQASEKSRRRLGIAVILLPMFLVALYFAPMAVMLPYGLRADLIDFVSLFASDRHIFDPLLNSGLCRNGVYRRGEFLATEHLQNVPASHIGCFRLSRAVSFGRSCGSFYCSGSRGCVTFLRTARMLQCGDSYLLFKCGSLVQHLFFFTGWEWLELEQRILTFPTLRDALLQN